MYLPQNLQQPLIENQGFQKQINPYQPTNYCVPADQDIRQSYAADLNKLQQKKQSYHVKALLSSLIIWAGLPTFIVLFLKNVIDISIGGIIGICVGIYIFYLLLSMCCNPLFDYLSKIEHGAKFKQEYQRVKSLVGYFIFYAQCYHYQTRHHTRTVSDGKGGTKTQHYTTTQKVITHRSTQNIHPVYTLDESGKVEDVRALTLIIFVHYLVNYRFIDNNSRQYFDYIWYNFKCRNKFDLHQDYSFRYNVPGLNQRMTFFIGDKKPNWYAKLIFMSFLGLIWPYSMYIQSKISRFNLKFLKALTMSSSY